MNKNRLLAVVCFSVFLAGVLLRYDFICKRNRPSDPANIVGDSAWYIYQSGNIYSQDTPPALYDTLYPPGAAMYFGALRWMDPSLGTIDLLQWLLACCVPLVLACIAERISGERQAYLVLLFSSLYFPFWEYFGYFLSEGPFITTLLFSFLFLVLSLQSGSRRGALLWGFFAGCMLGASAACKSCSLLSAAFVLAALLYSRREDRARVWTSVAPAMFGLALLLIPLSIRATRLNEGRFLLIANDAQRTFLLGHQGKVGLTWWYDDARNFRVNFINPSAVQHAYTEQKSYHFGPYDSSANYKAGWSWIKENPWDAFLLSVEHVLDMFVTALPWPGYFRWYARWTVLFNAIFLAFLLAPALVHLARSARPMLRADPRFTGDLMLAAAVLSIYVIAFFFLGEGRYRICYDGFMLLLAAKVLSRQELTSFDILAARQYTTQLQQKHLSSGQGESDEHPLQTVSA